MEVEAERSRCGLLEIVATPGELPVRGEERSGLLVNCTKAGERVEPAKADGVLVPTVEWRDQLAQDLDAKDVEEAEVYADLTDSPEGMFRPTHTWSIFTLDQSDEG